MKIIPDNLLQLSLTIAIAAVLSISTTAYADDDDYYERRYSRYDDRGDDYAYRRYDRNKYRKYRKYRKHHHAHRHNHRHRHSHRHDYNSGYVRGYTRAYNDYRGNYRRYPQPRYDYRPNHYTQIIYPAAPVYYPPRANVVFGVDTGHTRIMLRY